MCWIYNSHTNFLRKATESSEIVSNNIYSAIPTALFLSSLFIFLHQHFHRSTTSYTKWKTYLIRYVQFTWIFFNATRLWFVLIFTCKRLIVMTEHYIEMELYEEDKYSTRALTYGTAFTFVTSISIIPGLLIYVNYLNQYEMPNFLMWVMEDPYVRHEIGIAGHCLERPLHLDSKKLKNCPYRSKRSTSFDANPWVSEKPDISSRNCKSMIEHNVVNCVEDLLD